MATTPGFGSAYKSTPQNLFTVETDQLGKDIYTSVGSGAAITFDTAAASAGSDITDNNDGTYSLSAGLDYLVTATAVLNNVSATPAAPPVLAVIDTADDSVIGTTVPAAETLTTVIPASITPVTISVIAAAPNSDTGGTWAYPAQVTQATLTIQVIGGF